MPLQQTFGNVTSDAYGGGVAAVPVYIEDVYSTFLYTGNSSTQTITNGIDLAGKGGLVWTKSRSLGVNHSLYDTARGIYNHITTNSTAAQVYDTTGLSAFGATGYTVLSDSKLNGSGYTYVSWTFREAPKFFDVVTYTGDGTNNRQILHSLAATPGCVIVKRLNAVTDWLVWHRSSGAGFNAATLNGTGTFGSSGFGPSTAFTDTYFTVANQAETNASGGTYVAYIFAHNAGGFGLTGTDNVISCGSLTTAADGSASVTLGYEPQWILLKQTNAADNWVIVDNMRGMPVDGATGNDRVLWPNLSSAEDKHAYFDPTATGFTLPAGGWLAGSGTFIYIAIRRGPMKVPTDGTTVFGLNARSGTGANATVTGGQVDDAVLIKNRGSAVADLMSSRLTGTGYLVTSSTAAEVAAGTTILQPNPWDVMDGVKVGTTSTITNASSNTFINYLFRRAPGFFDEVCYTGTGVARTVSHNLGVAPELMIVKRRSAAANWTVYNSSITATKYLQLDFTGAASTNSTYWNNTTPTTTDFTVGTVSDVNGSASTYVAYLFATCAGVSKVGNYTGNGSTQTINCGFTGGARFVLIKRTDSTGDWYVYDTARGMTTLTDPYLLINSTAAESATLGSVTTVSTGFAVNASILAAINTNAASYIFLAIA